jgi:sulfite reductase (ferredoxin)
VNYRCRSEEVPEALERLFRHYLATRSAGENLRAWFAGRGDEELRTALDGVPEAAQVS